MIKNIKYLKNFGIFKNYTPKDKEVEDFNKFNLIYGWNGSGKTTLVTLFELLKKKQMDRFSSADFAINLKDKDKTTKKITQKNLNDSNLNIHIFNNTFIKENIDWDNSVKSILLIAEEKITERKQLENLKEKQKKIKEDKDTRDSAIKRNEQEIASFMTRTAKDIKSNLKAIDTNDGYFMNYDKRKLKGFMDQNAEAIKQKSGLLNEHQINQYIEGAKPNKKDAIIFNMPLYNFEKLKIKEKEIINLLEKNILSNTIDRLISNSDIQSWVEKGLEIHKKHHSNQCEFCGNSLSEERIKQLEGHFSKEFEHFKVSLKNTLEAIKEHYIQIDNNLPRSEQFYPEYVDNFKEESQKLTDISKKINNQLEQWKCVLNKKIENPFDTSLSIDALDESLFKNLNSHIESIKKNVEQHNQKTQNFENETKERKKALELHYTTEKLQGFNYYSKQLDIIKQKENLKELKNQIDKKQITIQKLEQSLSNEGIGAKKINSAIHKFLGRNDLSLQFNQEKKGYDITRNQEAGQHIQYLSEGEKRAIAFVYFIIKLQEKSNKIKESIIVIDDPMSSLDSNNLFHAYSFLRSNCKQAKQLFVFTHNFTYFKLVRDWFVKTNDNLKREKKSKDPVANFFTVNATVLPPQSTKLNNMSDNHKNQPSLQTVQLSRHANLNNMPDSLLKYHSEYHYIFETLFSFKDSENLDINQAFLTANLSRKLLESFFYFKYPKHRSDLGSLLESGLKDCENTTPEIKDKIHNFINKYSHSDKIEINEDTAENLMGESYPVIKDIFKWIEEVDKTHYDEMVQSVKNTEQV